MIVVDTNIIAYLYLPSTYTERAEQLLEQDPIWVAPILWRSEFRNVLALYLRKRLINLEKALQLQGEAESLLRDHEYEVSSLDVLKLAQESSCSAYDCEFVTLAASLEIPLITMDQSLLKTFPSIARSL